MKHTWRVPILLLLPALIVAAAFVQHRRSTVTVAASRPDVAVPTVAASGASSSTWYCAAGTATGAADAFADQSIVVSNAGDSDATGIVTAFSDTGNQASRAITVKANGTTTVRTSDVLKAPWASMVVEVTGGGIAVSQEFRGTAGRAADDCVSAPASTWWLPAGTTRAGARMFVALFNPFPGEATVDVQFDTEDGARSPQQLQGMVVRGGRLAVIDVSAIVTLRERVSTTVTVRAGRVVAEQLQSYDGRSGSALGLAAMTGATVAAPVWSFPVTTPASMTGKEIVAVTNPGESDVDVQVEVQLDDAATNGSVEPFVVSVPARRSVTIDLAADPRLPKGVGRWYIVRAPSGASIVAARSIAVPKVGTAGGLAMSMGIPVVATQWVGTTPVPGESSSSLVAIVNPNASRSAVVSLSIGAAGRSKAVTDATKVTLAPGQRIVIDVLRFLGARSEGPYEVTSDVPVVVGQWITFATPTDVTSLDAFPVAGTSSFPTDVITPEQVEIIGLAPRSDDTIPTTTTTAPTTTTTVAATPLPVAPN